MRLPVLGSIGAAITVPALAVASVIASPAREASAKQEYARKEGKACVYCHVNANGGGARNAKGEEYAKNGHKFAPEVKRYGEDNAFKTEANAKAFELVRAA